MPYPLGHGGYMNAQCSTFCQRYVHCYCTSCLQALLRHVNGFTKFSLQQCHAFLEVNLH